MPKPRPRDLPPSRRPGGGGLARPASQAARRPAASEIAAKMQGLADQIDHLPDELARAVSDEAPRAGSRVTGAEVVDAGLLHRGSKPTTAHVVTIDAYPDPERPGGVAVRLDGWEGFLLVNLTRDRATLLANRLLAAVEKSQAWYGAGG